MDDVRLPEATRPGRTALRVADLDGAVEFYRDVVGLEPGERTASRATLGAGGTPVLELAGDGESRSEEGAGLYHNAFRVPTREALGAAVRRVRDRWRLSGASDHGVSEALYLTDPEGNGVEIYRDRPRDAWPVAGDGAVEMHTRPLDLEAVAAEGGEGETVPPETDLGHVHLEVTSIERARRFYVETLGLGVRQEWNGATFLAADDYHHHVGVNAWHGRSGPAAGRGLAWFELVVPDEGTVETLRRRVADAGGSVEEREDGIEVADPDGIAVRVRAEE